MLGQNYLHEDDLLGEEEPQVLVQLPAHQALQLQEAGFDRFEELPCEGLTVREKYDCAGVFRSGAQLEVPKDIDKVGQFLDLRRDHF